MKYCVSLICSIVAYAIFACASYSYNYIDCIQGINNYDVHSVFVSSNRKTIDYTVSNNMVVDSPLTVITKLASNTQLKLLGVSAPEMIYCALQYKKIPGGTWTTASEYSFPSGTIGTRSTQSF